MAQLVRASTSDVCRVERHRFEPLNIKNQYHLPCTIYTLSISSPKGQYTTETDRKKQS